MTFKRLVRKLLRVFSSVRRFDAEKGMSRFRIVIEDLADTGLSIVEKVIPLVALVAFIFLIYDAGYDPFYDHPTALYRNWHGVLYVLQTLIAIRFVLALIKPRKWKSRIFRFAIVLLIFYANYAIVEVINLQPVYSNASFVTQKILLYTIVSFIFITEVSVVLQLVYRGGINPALLFLGSFATLIVCGALLLMLPNSTTQGISPVDAFFTATSAVCITGLSVVDTQTAFTTVGKVIILLLIQVGGLGVMTFAALITYLFMGSVSFQNQLALKDMLSSNRISNAITLVIRVIVVTLFFELAGALLIHSSLKEGMFDSASEKIFFSIFHAVSAFCNAGFSTLTNGLYEPAIRYNYNLHLIIALLIILGGMGFPIVFNLFTFIRIKVRNLIRRLLKDSRQEHFTHIISTASRLGLATTLVLLVAGFVAYLVLEYDATLRDHPSLWGKIVTSFFGSVTPRTAGFNTVDLTLFTLPTVMIYLLFMWIGASPGSTGGGIKTTTVAVALLNLRSIVLRKDRTEVFRTQISEGSINRSFAIVLLSLLVLGLTVLLVAINDGEKGLLKIAFEAFSAFGTVGLTLGITPQLSDFSKIVLAITMLIGRVGALTLLFSFVAQGRQQYHRYPTEEVTF